MRIALYKLTFLFIFLGLPFLVVGCFLNRNAADASIHRSNNELAMERARLDAARAQAQAEADAAAARARADALIAGEQTEQSALRELGASERLYSQQNYFLQKQAEGTNRLIIALGFIGVFGLIGGLIALKVWTMYNPPPVPWGSPNYQQLPDVPFSHLISDRAKRVGWNVYYGADGRPYGQRTKGRITQVVGVIEDNQRQG